MTTDQIRETIAESGKTTIAQVVDYFKKRGLKADMNVVKQEAKQMISEMRKYM